MPDGTAPTTAAQAPSGLARALSWVAAGHVASQVSWYGSLIVLAALLPPRAFGTVAVGAVVVSVAGLLMESGTRGSIVASARLDRDQLESTVLVMFGVGLALALGLGALAEPIVGTFAEGGDAAAVRVLFATLAVNALGVVPLALIDKRMEFKRHAAVRVGGSTIASATAICAAVLGAGVWALVARQLVAQAVVAALAWIAARDLLPTRPAGQPPRRSWRLRRQGATWFVVLAATDLLALSIDNLVVGRATDAERLGLYTLAFTLGFAPLTQFSWQLGQVLFPAAAATADLETVASRTMTAARLAALLLLPLVPPAIVLAPVVVPALLGPEWRGMVAPFQILLVVGVAHGLVNVIGESLSGTGHIRFRAQLGIVWSVATIGAIVVLVEADGIRGAAIAHLAVFVPLALAYGIWGTRRIGASPARLWAALRGVVVPVAAQALTTAAVASVLAAAGAPPPASSSIAAAVGLAVVTLLLLRQPASPLREAQAMLAGRLRRRP